MAHELDCAEHSHVQRDEYDVCLACERAKKIGPCGCAFEVVPLRGPNKDCLACKGTGFTRDRDAMFFIL